MKTLITAYTFAAASKQITFTGINPISLENLLLITNTTDNIIIYNFADPTKGGTVSTNVLTLTYNTTTMSNTDKLQIFYDLSLDFGAGNKTTTGTQRVTLATDQLAVPVSNAGTFVTQENGAALTAMQLIDDTVFVDNTAFTDGTSKVNSAGYFYSDVAGTALTENDIGIARMSINRAQVGVIEDGATRARYATVKAASTAAVAGDTALVVAVSPNNTINVASHAVTNAGTFAVQAAATLAAETTKVIGTVNIASAQTLGTVTTVSTVTNLSQMGGQAIALGSGARSAGTQRVTVCTDDLIAVVAQPLGSSAYAPANATTAAYAASLVVKASAGVLYSYWI
jgi:hypothetical protein